MLLTLHQLADFRRKLKGARHRDAGEPGEPGGPLPPAHCRVALTDAQGNARRWVPKPAARKPVGHRYPDGTTLEERDGQRGVWVPIGEHGTDYLAIDPETGDVCCGLCAAAKNGGAQ